MPVALDKLVMKNRRIRFDEVRTEGKLLVSLLRGWRLIHPWPQPNKQTEGSQHVTVLLNFFDELRRIAPIPKR